MLSSGDANEEEFEHPDRKYARAFYSGGRRWTKSGEYDNAIADYSEAIRLDPEFALAYAMRGFAYQRKRSIDSAIADYTRALELGLETDVEVRVWIRRSSCYHENGDLAEALEDADHALAVNPMDANAHIERGLIHWSMGEHQRALSDYSRALSFDSESAGAYHGRGTLRIDLGEYRKAIADLSAAIRLEPSYVNSYNNRAIAWKHLQRYGKAIADFRQAIHLETASDHTYAALAWLLATCPVRRYRDGAEAVRLAEIACERSDFGDANFICTLAAAHAEKGNPSEAAAWQRKTINLVPAAEREEMQEWVEWFEDGNAYREDHCGILKSLWLWVREIFV